MPCRAARQPGTSHGHKTSGQSYPARPRGALQPPHTPQHAASLALCPAGPVPTQPLFCQATEFFLLRRCQGWAVSLAGGTAAGTRPSAPPEPSLQAAMGKLRHSSGLSCWALAVPWLRGARAGGLHSAQQHRGARMNSPGPGARDTAPSHRGLMSVPRGPAPLGLLLRSLRDRSKQTAASFHSCLMEKAGAVLTLRQ